MFFAATEQGEHIRLENIDYMNKSQNSITNNNSIGLSLWDITGILLQKVHWLIIAGIAAAAVVYLAVSLLVTPTYESRVSFYVYNSTSAQSGSINNSDLQAAESLATTYSQILVSNSMLDAVLDNLSPDRNLSRKDLSNMVEASVITNTQLLEVVVTSTDPSFACEIAKSFAMVAPTEIVRITKAGSVEVVDQPEVATQQSTPRTILDSAIGFVIGVMIISLLIVIKALADTTIYLPEDIEKTTGVTILGQIPEILVTDDEHEFWSLTNGGVIHCED